MWFAVLGLGGGLLLLAWVVTVLRKWHEYDEKIATQRYARHTDGFRVDELLAEIARRDALAAMAEEQRLQEAPTREFARV